MPTKPPIHRPPASANHHAALTAAKRLRDRQRGSASKRGYTHKWSKAAKEYLGIHRYCVVCLLEGRMTPATVVDHKIAHRGDHRLFWDRSNWQALCPSCHSSKTARHDGGFGNRRRHAVTRGRPAATKGQPRE